jgi:transposase
VVVDGALCGHLTILLSTPSIKLSDSGQIYLGNVCFSKVGNKPLVERLYIVSVCLLAHTFTYFRLHSSNGVFGNLNFVPVPGHWGTLPQSMKGAPNGTTTKNVHGCFQAAAVDRLYDTGATQGSIAKELGITGTQLKTWRLEIEAFGSAEAKRRQKANAAELERLRKDNKRLTQEVEILHKASAFFATRVVKP